MADATPAWRPDTLARFPDPRGATAHGLVTVTPHLDVPLLLAAYSQGLFPWSSGPVSWYSPDPRAIFLPQQVHLPRNLAKLCRRQRLRATYDLAFDQVVAGCRSAHAAEGEWLDATLCRAYGELHRSGFAHSVEIWQDEALVGGLYGVQLGALFAGESMFHRTANASKAAFAALLPQLAHQGVWLLDAQVLNAHTARLGACAVPRAAYLAALARAVPATQLLQPCRWLPLVG